MLFELRTDTLWPGKAAEFVDLSGSLGVPIRGEKYGRLEGFWTVDIGPQHTIVHLWSHADFAARQDARTRMAQDDDWLTKYMPRIEPLMQQQEIRLMSPVCPFVSQIEEGGVYELRRTVTRPFAVTDWTDILIASLPNLKRHMSFVGCWSTIAGRPNEIYTLWRHANEAASRKAWAEPECAAANTEMDALVFEEDNAILTPVSFSPLGQSPK